MAECVLMRLTDLLALSHVPRWAIVAHTRVQSVADHSFRVAVITQELMEREFGRRLTAQELWWCLVHDGSESRSGDISGPYKRMVGNSGEPISEADLKACPWLREEVDRIDGIDPDFLRLFKIADLMEAATYIKMWGVGPHAQSAFLKIEHEITALISAGEYDAWKVSEVYQAIYQEQER